MRRKCICNSDQVDLFDDHRHLHAVMDGLNTNGFKRINYIKNPAYTKYLEKLAQSIKHVELFDTAKDADINTRAAAICEGMYNTIHKTANLISEEAVADGVTHWTFGHSVGQSLNPNVGGILQRAMVYVLKADGYMFEVQSKLNGRRVDIIIIGRNGVLFKRPIAVSLKMSKRDRTNDDVFPLQITCWGEVTKNSLEKFLAEGKILVVISDESRDKLINFAAKSGVNIKIYNLTDGLRLAEESACA